MENEILVSIVIPCYNDAQYVEQSVQSALDQTCQNVEIILVDDGSDTETKVILEKLKPKIDKLITQKNQGQSSARNRGIEQARGIYILVLDSDDFFDPTYCEKAILVLKNDQVVKLVSSFVNRIYEGKPISVFKPHGGDLKDFLMHNCAMGSVLFKKSDWRSINGYDEGMRTGFEDWDFYIRLLKNGGNCHVIEENLFNYRQKKNSTTTKANKIKFELLKYMYTKHRTLYIEHFDLLIDHLLYRIEREEKDKIKNIHRIDFIIGSLILKPFRFVKNLFTQ